MNGNDPGFEKPKGPNRRWIGMLARTAGQITAVAMLLAVIRALMKK